MLDCKGTDDGISCLTPLQVESARKMYGPVINPQSKQVIYPGFMPGSELGWDTLTSVERDGRIGYFQLAFENPKWDYRTIDFSRDPQRLEQIDNGTVNALNPSLEPFFARGGKLLHYHGWTDPAVAPLGSINYYKSVLSAVGGRRKVCDSYRLLMIPGMDHCGGGDGPDHFDAVVVLEQWVENGKPPDRIIASRVRNGKWIEHVRSVPIRRQHSTSEPEALTSPRTLAAALRN